MGLPGWWKIMLNHSNHINPGSDYFVRTGIRLIYEITGIVKIMTIILIVEILVQNRDREIHGNHSNHRNPGSDLRGS